MPDPSRVESRLEKMEELHEAGGFCEKNRVELWKALADLRDRTTRLEIKLLVGGTVLSVIGPLAAQWIMRKF